MSVKESFFKEIEDKRRIRDYILGKRSIAESIIEQEEGDIIFPDLEQRKIDCRTLQNEWNKILPSKNELVLAAGVVGYWTGIARFSSAASKEISNERAFDVAPVIAVLDSLCYSQERISSVRISEQLTELEFKLLSEKWKKESKYISLIKKRFDLESYKQIIKMGVRVIPILLKELIDKKYYWFVALKEITNHDPVKQEHFHDFSKMTNDWIEWCKENII